MNDSSTTGYFLVESLVAFQRYINKKCSHIIFLYLPKLALPALFLKALLQPSLNRHVLYESYTNVLYDCSVLVATLLCACLEDLHVLQFLARVKVYEPDDRQLKDISWVTYPIPTWKWQERLFNHEQVQNLDHHQQNRLLIPAGWKRTPYMTLTKKWSLFTWKKLNSPAIFFS